MEKGTACKTAWLRETLRHSRRRARAVELVPVQNSQHSQEFGFVLRGALGGVPVYAFKEHIRQHASDGWPRSG
jgi:hypothetical protein